MFAYICVAYLVSYATTVAEIDRTQALFGVAVAAVVGVAMAPTAGVTGSLFSLAFDPDVRYSGVSIGYTLSQVVGSAFAPTIATALYAATNTSTRSWRIWLWCRRSRRSRRTSYRVRGRVRRRTSLTNSTIERRTDSNSSDTSRVSTIANGRVVTTAPRPYSMCQDPGWMLSPRA